MDDAGRPRVTCAECGRVDDGERGWEAHLTDDEPSVAVVFCPACAEREFGQDDDA